MFLIPALAALNARPRYASSKEASLNSSWIFIGVVLIFIIGLRFKVGGDWAAYMRHIRFVAPDMSFREAIMSSEPGYWLLNKLIVSLGIGDLGIVFLNLISACIFVYGLIVFCLYMPRPWLALAVSIPYLVVVVGMGFTRQSAALGFEMLGLVALSRKRFFWFSVWILLAASFHRTAIVILPIATLIVSKNLWISRASIILVALVAYDAFLSKDIDDLILNYVTNEYQSDGALVRLSMNLLPAILFLSRRSRINMLATDRGIWSIFSYISIALFIGYFFTSASTALDRLALYCIPLQVFVFSHFPELMGFSGRRNSAIVFIALLPFGVVLAVWLLFANNSAAWVPYLSSVFYLDILTLR